MEIEKKVYLYGFLKGEVTYDEKELLSENLELKKRIQELEHQHSADIHYHIDHIDTLNIGDNVENKFS